MDFVIELVLEILGDIGEDIFSVLINSRRISKPIRYLAISVLHMALLALFVFLAFISQVLWGSILCSIIGLLIIISWISLIRKIKKAPPSYKQHKQGG